MLPGCTYCHEDGTTIFLALDEATGLQLTLLHRAWLSLRAAMYAAARGSTERRDYEGALKELLFVASSEGIHGVLRAFAERLYDEELVPLMLKNLGGALFYDAVTDRVSFQPMKQL
ncbi:hypothetical protein DB347_17875 [Opitutaceae bacterium EW11]|nr:hypothetical protein DB347_17875 [Opitutaceae bacterium EW11]